MALSGMAQDAFYATSLKEVMNRFNWDRIDLSKMDIEGSEKSILEHDYDDWLSRTAVFIVELHDDLQKGCSEVFLKTVSQYNFKIMPKFDNFVLIRE
jgi:hypothetical protein